MIHIESNQMEVDHIKRFCNKYNVNRNIFDIIIKAYNDGEDSAIFDFYFEYEGIILLFVDVLRIIRIKGEINAYNEKEERWIKLDEINFNKYNYRDYDRHYDNFDQTRIKMKIDFND